MTRHDQDDQII